MNSIDQGICILEMLFDDQDRPVDYRFMEVNSVFEDQTGLQDPIGKTARELIPELEDFWFETYGQVAKSREPVRFENYSESMDRWFDVHAFPVDRADQHRVALLFSDITARKRREANAEFLTELSEGFSRLVGFEEIMARVAEKLADHLGVDRVAFARVDESEAEAINMYDYHPADQEDAAGEFRLRDYFTDQALAELRGGQPVVVDDVGADRRTAELADNYRRYDTAAAVHVPHHSDGRLKFLLGVFRSTPHSWRDDEVELLCDVTDRLWYRLERARAEEQLRESQQRRRLHEAIMDATPDLQYIFGLDYTIQYANRALLEMWGKSWDEAIGERLIELGYEKWHAEMHEREVDHIVATGESVRGEVPFDHQSLGRRIYDYLLVPVFNEQGDVEAVAGTTRDVTERKEAEEALREADRRKDRFLGLLSHELRNPLAPIRLSLHLLEDAEPGSEREQRALRVIERQTDQLTRLVDDLLDVTRITRDKIELQCQPVELNQLVEAAVEDHRAVMEERETILEYEPASRSIVVDGDANRLSQVIGNLLNNAAKFTDPAGRAAVVVEADTDAGAARIRVIDDGIGIEPDAIRELFEPFAQADTSIHENTEGLGLGLALVKGLVELHKGDVQVHSEGKEKGTEFVITLPARFETQHREETESPQATAGGLRVLLIEDNEDIATSLKMVLELQGHQVHIAHDGQTGVDKVRRESPEVVICDIGLPEMNGYQVAQAISDQPELAVRSLIALSGYASEGDIRQSRDAGFDHHLAKPPDIDRINEILTAVSEGE